MLFLVCHASLAVVVSTVGISDSVFEISLFPFRIGLAKGAHFSRYSLGMWLLTVTQKVADIAHLSLHQRSSCASWEWSESWGKTHGFLHILCLSYIPVISFCLPYSTRRYELLSLSCRWRHCLKKGKVPCPRSMVSEYQRYRGNLEFHLRRKPLIERVIWRGPQYMGGLSIRDLMRSTFQREWVKLRAGHNNYC